MAVRKRCGRVDERKVSEVMEALLRGDFVPGDLSGLRSLAKGTCREGMSCMDSPGVGEDRRVSQMPIVPSREQVARVKALPGWKATCFTLKE